MIKYMFESPIHIHLCNIKRVTSRAKFLKAASLIVWDECSMTHKRDFEANDKSLQDICQNSLPFG